MIDHEIARRETRARRAAHAQGLAVCKNRSRRTDAWNHGGYMLVNPDTKAVVAGGEIDGFSLDLEALEAALAEA